VAEAGCGSKAGSKQGDTRRDCRINVCAVGFFPGSWFSVSYAEKRQKYRSREATRQFLMDETSRLPRLSLGGFAGLGRIVAFAVDRRDLTAHGAQIRGKLPAMMGGMQNADLREADCRQLKKAAKVDDFDERLAMQLGQLGKVFLEPFHVKRSDIRRSLDRFRLRPRRGIERAVQNGFEEANLGHGD